MNSHLTNKLLSSNYAARLNGFIPDATPLNHFTSGIWITPISYFHLPSVINQAPGPASEGNVGKGEEGGTANSYRQQEMGTEMESGGADPE